MEGIIAWNIFYLVCFNRFLTIYVTKFPHETYKTSFWLGLFLKGNILFKIKFKTRNICFSFRILLSFFLSFSLSSCFLSFFSVYKHCKKSNIKKVLGSSFKIGHKSKNLNVFENRSFLFICILLFLEKD